MIRRTLRSLAIATTAAFLALTTSGCSNSRPAGIADRPGESFVELSDLQAELVGTELKIKVHYKLPDGLPNQDSWFTFRFEVNGGRNGAILVRKQGRELKEEGIIEGTTSSVFLKRVSGTFGAKVQQSPNKTGPFHDVSEQLTVEF